MKTLSQRTESVLLILLNFIGIASYLYFAAFGWALPGDRASGILPTGEPFVWFIGVFPITAVFFAINLTWGIVIIARRHWKRGYWWLLTAACWFIAVGVDFAHH